MAVEWVREPFGYEESLSSLAPYVRRWFESTFSQLTPPQRFSFKLIAEGNNVVIASPTGSGKTLAAFMAILSELFKMGERGELGDSIYCVYVSPLKALDNDVKKNLLAPLIGIREIAIADGLKLPEIRVALRTGDVTQSEKQKQLANPPHILITTPESLAVLLNAPKFSNSLKSVRWVVVDEIHELVSSKRGVHLSLSLERLVDLVGREFVRIGLGATLHPLEEAAKFLVGYRGGAPRDCKLVDVTWYKPLEVKVMCPVRDLVHASADELNESMYNLLNRLISRHITTLVFTNTRSGTERVTYHLKRKWKDRYNDDTIGAHHGSLSREIRLDVENRLKSGKLKAVISSTSLELGIDVGFIDLVVQIGSPKSVTRAVQRIGRSGHKFEDTSRGIIVALDRDDLVEVAVMLKCAIEKRLDRVQVVRRSLDILAQHVVGMALHRKWRFDEALELIRRAYPYNDLTEGEFRSVLRYLAGHYVDLEDRRVYGKIWYDEEEGVFGRRGKYTRVIYYLNIGAIPDETKVDVYRLPEKVHVGEIEEGFLERLRPGDIFVLGGKLFVFKHARGMRCFVEAAPKGAAPTIPSWFSEMLPLSFDLALEVQRFRDEVARMISSGYDRREVVSWIADNYPVERRAAGLIYEYIREQLLFTGGKVPGFMEVLVERTRFSGRDYLVFHCLFGRRVNDALARAFGIAASDALGSSVGLIVNDNGFSLILPPGREVDERELFNTVAKYSLEDVLRSNIRRTELMRRRFRHVAARSFLVLRNYKGYKISVNKQHMNAQTLLRVCEEISDDFPAISETYREVLMDVMDLEGAEKVLAWLRSGDLKVSTISTSSPSPFSHNIILAGDADVILMKDRRRRLMELHEAVMRKIRSGGS